MNYIFLLVAMIISIYSFTFARYLGASGNKRGMLGVLFLILINLSLSIYRMISAG